MSEELSLPFVGFIKCVSIITEGLLLSNARLRKSSHIDNREMNVAVVLDGDHPVE